MFEYMSNAPRDRLPDPRRFPGMNARGHSGPTPYINYMAPGTSPVEYDRVIERRRAVALAHHFREAEGLSIKQIADRLGRSPATVKAYF